MKETIPNSQYDVARPDSRPVKLATCPRRRMVRLVVASKRVVDQDASLLGGLYRGMTYDRPIGPADA